MTQPDAIIVNGERRELAHPTTVGSLVSDIVDKELLPDGTPSDGSRLGIAVAVDGEVIRRGRWSEFVLADGLTVDIVTAVQGG